MPHYPTPLKKYGQHFLKNPAIAKKIVALAQLPPSVRVLEIGAGRGILTRAILEHSNAKLLVIEKDRNLLPLLHPLQEQYKGRLQIIAGDALAWQKTTTIDNPPYVIANLPYNIASQLLVNFCYQHHHYKRLILMFQKEVAERITAKVGDKSYGRLAILTQTVGRAEIVMTLSPQEFHPPPKIKSAVVVIDFHSTPPPCDLDDLGHITNILFQQRRKQMQNGLGKLLGDKNDAKAMIKKLGWDEKIRAESLSPKDFWLLANQYKRPS